MPAHILTINGGSSSVKFALFMVGDAEPSSLRRQMSGAIQRVGLPGARFRVADASGQAIEDQSLSIANQSEAAETLVDWVRHKIGLESITAVGHRIVHGGPRYLNHALIRAEMLTELRRVSAMDPEHLPGELALVDAFARQLPKLPQIACFDTAFHRDLPEVTSRLPLPQKYADGGIRRYGFHGLSYAYLMEQLSLTTKDSSPLLQGKDRVAGNSRIILAHLGNGCSMAAVRDGKCIDTTMSFTPTAGLVMGTRSGDLDPGVVVYLMREEKMSADQIDDLVNRKSGLLGISGISSDMRDLLDQRSTNPRAALAVDIFCFQARKQLGALTAVLGGLDTLVFSGGIGENSPEIRSQICSELDYLGVSMDASQNAASAATISSDSSQVSVRVIPTDEELMIARICKKLIAKN